MPHEERVVLEGDALRRARHDLRTPLTIITGFADVLGSERPVSEEERRAFALRIQAAADELRGLLDDLLG